MRKRVTALTAALFAALVLAATAGAVITVTQGQPGPGSQNLSPWNCQGRTYSLANGPIRLVFGWAANTQSQMSGFFQYSSGSVSISGTDTFADSWVGGNSGTPYVTQKGIAWSQLEAIKATPPGGGTQIDAFASNYRGVLSIAPGTYTLSVQFQFAHPVQDGFGVFTSKTPLANTPCTFTVTA
jgi:hypothetical protein